MSRLVGDQATAVEEVIITTFEAAQADPGCDSTGPFDEVQQAKMSLQYAVASALRFGRVDEETYTRRQDPELLRLVGCTRIEVDDAFGRALLEARQPARIEVRLSDGTERHATLDDVPWLDDDAVERRFRDVAATVLPAAAVDRIVVLVDELWDHDSCSKLFELFASSTPMLPGLPTASGVAS